MTFWTMPSRFVLCSLRLRWRRYRRRAHSCVRNCLYWVRAAVIFTSSVMGLTRARCSRCNYQRRSMAPAQSLSCRNRLHMHSTPTVNQPALRVAPTPVALLEVSWLLYCLCQLLQLRMSSIAKGRSGLPSQRNHLHCFLTAAPAWLVSLLPCRKLTWTYLLSVPC